ncbi:hypothetical protein CRM22_002076 [Opisthorchis felineus]|uniref:J domain-containing protein n=1 Tax=Opisthorchis felineus TaxID=147828 RepID=A0A4S2MDP3_OPIFE|nr:hypothetical protein CRM22_002076 [Opisthorchis felineus]
MDLDFLSCLDALADTCYYKILGVDSSSTVEQIEAEFRLKAREFHPDKSDNPDSTFQFQAINRAKQVLTDPKLRKQYECWKSSGLNIPFERWLLLKDQFHTCMHWCAVSNNADKMLPPADALSVSSGHGPFAVIQEHNPCNNLLSQFRAYKI